MGEETPLEGVLLRSRGHVREVILNEPRRRNPMSPAIMAGLIAACDRLEADEDAYVTVLTGAGSAFCAGGDLRHNDAHLGGSSGSDQRFLSELYKPFLRVLDLPMPTIAALNGPAIGGGLALALLCDIRVAATDALLKPAFASLGFSPGLGLTYTLARHVGRGQAAELLFADRAVTGAEAAAAGLVNQAVAGEELAETVEGLAEEIAANSPLANRLIKALLADDYRRDLRSRLTSEVLAQVVTSTSDDYRRRRDSVAGAVGREN